MKCEKCSKPVKENTEGNNKYCQGHSIFEQPEDKKEIKARLEYLRGELRAERISYGELAELQSLTKHIDSSDVELLEAAGVPENCDLCYEGNCSHSCHSKYMDK